MSLEKRRGALIVVEGLDRAGKSTQHAEICTILEREGYRVLRMRFPGVTSCLSILRQKLNIYRLQDRSTAVGKSIDAYLCGTSQAEDHAIHLLFSANRWEAAESISKAIEDGIMVVIDRYYYSGIVYSAAKQNSTLSLHWARQMEIGLPRPDLCIFLDITAEKAAERGGYGNERYEKREMQAVVRRLFLDLFKHGDEGEDVRKIDAGRAVDEVSAEIRQHILGLLQSDGLMKSVRLVR